MPLSFLFFILLCLESVHFVSGVEPGVGLDHFTTVGSNFPNSLYDRRFFSIELLDDRAWRYDVRESNAMLILIFPGDDVESIKGKVLVNDVFKPFDSLRMVQHEDGHKPWIWLAISSCAYFQLPKQLQSHLKAIKLYPFPSSPEGSVVFFNGLLKLPYSDRAAFWRRVDDLHRYVP